VGNVSFFTRTLQVRGSWSAQQPVSELVQNIFAMQKFPLQGWHSSSSQEALLGQPPSLWDTSLASSPSVTKPIDPRQAAIRLSKLSSSNGDIGSHRRKTFSARQGRLCRARCTAELEATLPPSHLLRGSARCSEAAAHHDICSSSCSLPRAVSLVWGASNLVPKGFRGSRKPSAIISSLVAKKGQKMPLEHVTTRVDRSRG